MSKIYEALQRAEEERRASGAVVTPGENITSQTPQGATEIFSAPATTITEAVFANVRTEAWSPDWEKLPALMHRGMCVEQLRSLRSRLQEIRAQRQLKSILISSALPQEGKSFIAVNLAVSLARHQRSKVLLIDGDMRRHTLHKTLGANAVPGLAEYLSGAKELSDLLQQPDTASQQVPANYFPLAGITFLPAGQAGDRAADLSTSPLFREFIAKASTYFDWIIVDSSPLNLVSDAVNLGHACDGVLLIARSGVTQLAAAEHAVAEINPESLLGFVLNGATDAPGKGGYYAYDSMQESA